MIGLFKVAAKLKHVIVRYDSNDSLTCSRVIMISIRTGYVTAQTAYGRWNYRSDSFGKAFGTFCARHWERQVLQTHRIIELLRRDLDSVLRDPYKRLCWRGILPVSMHIHQLTRSSYPLEYKLFDCKPRNGGLSTATDTQINAENLTSGEMIQYDHSLTFRGTDGKRAFRAIRRG